MTRSQGGALLAIVAATAAALLAMGRLPICACGTVKLWHGAVMSSENSQHLTDFYTPSHVLHGLLFYAGLRWLAPGARFGWRLVLATLIEAAWEVGENTDAIIDRYRAATIALDYHGDSVVNSVSDIVAMWVGFALARALPVRASLALFVLTEALTVWLMRDGLVLNVLMLVWPLDAVRRWQTGG